MFGSNGMESGNLFIGTQTALPLWRDQNHQIDDERTLTARGRLRDRRPIMARAQNISICLLGSEQHKARPDFTDDSGFWLREQRVGKEMRSSTLMAQIVKIEEGSTETRILILPN